MNVYDGEVVTEILQQEGCVECGSFEEADIVLLITCSVRAHAENRVFSHIGELQIMKEKSKPGLITGILGCTAQKLGKEYTKRFPVVDIVLGTHSIEYLVPSILKVAEGKGPVIETDLKGRYVLSAKPGSRPESHSGFIPVSRGCSRRCSYCIVPSLRGSMSSRTPESIVEQAVRFAESGGFEITLLGQNIDAYGRDSGYKKGFAGLLGLVSAVKGLKKLSFVTSHPADFSRDILDVIRDNPVISPYFHIPPQSGSDRILKLMKRGYVKAAYLDLVYNIRNVLPHAELAGDIIVGFPGETDDDFEQTVDLIQKVRFQQVYVFKYSPREGTDAIENMIDDVPVQVKKDRNNHLLNIQQTIQREKNSTFIGQSVEVVVEGPSPKDSSRLFGRTHTNYRVVFDPVVPDDQRSGRISSVRIGSCTPLTLFGEELS